MPDMSNVSVPPAIRSPVIIGYQLGLSKLCEVRELCVLAGNAGGVTLVVHALFTI